MAKKSVKISLATKLRFLFGTSVLGIIAAALVVPWYFTEKLADQGVERPAAELTRLQYNEWFVKHKTLRSPSEITAYFTPSDPAPGGETKGREGPVFIRLKPGKDPIIRGLRKQAVAAFRRDGEQDLAVYREDNEQNQTVYRCFQAVRVENSCMGCHGSSATLKSQFQPDQLVGLIEVSIPEVVASGPLVWWTRGAFVVGGILGSFVALLLFAVITQRLILRPVRRLRDLADKVTEGDLSIRSTIRTGDELQRLGDSFNEMLEAIAEQHERLRSANRALDLKLGELSESNVALFQANKVKNEFLANVSHELRTPLNSIIGFGDLLADSTDERCRRYGQNITTSAKNLLSMINDLLDIAKIEAGRAEVRMDKVSVLDTCQTLEALMQPLADKKQLTLRSQIDPSLPLVVTDGAKLQQILYNLLSNAIKFTPSGGDVLLSAGFENPQGNGQSDLFVSVADNGPGIAESEQTRIFEKFYQLDRTLTKESSGTGLGLAIARELTNLLGARLALQSSPGHGATFTLYLPVKSP